MPALPAEAAAAVRDGRPTFELVEPARPETLDLVQDLVARLHADAGEQIAPDDLMRFESALVEIVANIIEHGAPAVDATQLHLHVALAHHGVDLLAVVTDDGEPAGVDLSASSMSGTDAEGGRGLAMARALSTDLTYRRIGPYNRWTVRCCLTNRTR